MRMWLRIVVLCLLICARGECQETVFALLKHDLKAADQYYEEGSYYPALTMYQSALKKNEADSDIYLKIARCHYKLKQYPLAASAYEHVLIEKNNLPVADTYLYAEIQAVLGDYEKAVNFYRAYYESAPDDDLVMKKIWRLQNIRYLYEDSIHFAFRRVPVNTASGELCPRPYPGGLVFLSNRNEVQIVNQVDAATNTPFYKLYQVKVHEDTISGSRGLDYGKVSLFDKDFNSGYHVGPVSFYDKGQKAVFASTGKESGSSGEKKLQLYFAQATKGKWKVVKEFPFNRTNYSFSDPYITEDGKTLFFSSDRRGGLGGRDIYKSVKILNQWTEPVNLGEPVNTPKDELFPFFHERTSTLYFTSNGHPGMGGLDIFQVMLSGNNFGEVTNAGYPINTRFDDFGIVVDSLARRGYLASNRKNGGADDDIYEFDIDLQTYPLVLDGILKIKEHSWSDSSELKIYPDAKLFLIDNIREVVVQEMKSDLKGKFSITIPYYSQYKLRIVGTGNEEHFVSFDIPKHKKESTQHEVVVVKDAFKSSDTQTLK